MPEIDWLNRKAKKLLAKAEQKFLPRDSSFEFCGVCHSHEGPQIRFAKSGPGIYAELSPSTLEVPNANQALYQIGHEVIHLLAPERSPPAKMIEEGLAVWFSLEESGLPPAYRNLAIQELKTLPKNANFLEAQNLYYELIAVSPIAIRILRKKRPNFFDMTPSFIMETIPGITDNLAKRLCENREMRPFGR